MLKRDMAKEIERLEAELAGLEGGNKWLQCMLKDEESVHQALITDCQAVKTALESAQDDLADQRKEIAELNKCAKIDGIMIARYQRVIDALLDNAEVRCANRQNMR